MPINDLNYRSCRRPACTKRALRNGLCASHRPETTSDGHHTGPVSKLSDDDVTEARRMLSRFVSKKDIANHFGVATSTLNRALRRPRLDRTVAP